MGRYKVDKFYTINLQRENFEYDNSYIQRPETTPVARPTRLGHIKREKLASALMKIASAILDEDKYGDYIESFHIGTDRIESIDLTNVHSIQLKASYVHEEAGGEL